MELLFLFFVIETTCHVIEVVSFPVFLLYLSFVVCQILNCFLLVLVPVSVAHDIVISEDVHIDILFILLLGRRFLHAVPVEVFKLCVGEDIVIDLCLRKNSPSFHSLVSRREVSFLFIQSDDVEPLTIFFSTTLGDC